MQRNAVKTQESTLMGARIAMAALLVATLVFTSSFPVLAQPQRALAVTEETEAEPDELQQRVEQSAADYDAAVARVEELEQQIADNQEQIAAIEEELPEQQERAADAMRDQYKFQREAPGILEMVLGSGSLSDFLSSWDYFTHVQARNYNELERLDQMRQELEATEQELAAARDGARAGADGRDALFRRRRLELRQGDVRLAVGRPHRRVPRRLAFGGAGHHVRFRRLGLRCRSALVAGHLQHRELQGPVLLPSA